VKHGLQGIQLNTWQDIRPGWRNGISNWLSGLGYPGARPALGRPIGRTRSRLRDLAALISRADNFILVSLRPYWDFMKSI
jgi:hypothetical protein